MNCKKCDRCGKPYELNLKKINVFDDWWRFNLKKDCHPYEEIKIDLCPDCQKDLYNWFKRW